MLASPKARRVALLASSSLVASSLAAIGGTFVALTPAVALAACAPTAAGTTSGTPASASGNQTCSGTDAGVFYDATGNLAVALSSEAVTNDGVGLNASAAQALALTGDSASSVTSTGTGVHITSASGSISVTLAGQVTSTAGVGGTGTAGVRATDGGAGDITLDLTGPVSGFSGVSGESLGGNVTITTMGNVSGSGGVTPQAPGVASLGVGASTSGSGAVSITTTGPVASAGDFGVIGFTTGNGAVNVTTGQVTGNLFAVGAQSNGGGAVNVQTNGAIVSTNTGTNLAAIFGVSKGGSVVIDTHSTVDGGWTGVSGDARGGAGAGTVAIDTTGGLVTARGVTGGGFLSWGVVGQSTNGAINISTGAIDGAEPGANASGIGAFSSTGNLNIATHGAISANFIGIDAATGGAGQINIDVGGSISASALGIVAMQSGSGVTNITDSNAATSISALGTGILAGSGLQTGAVNIGSGPNARFLGSVSSQFSDGIVAASAGPVQVFTAGDVTGGDGRAIFAVGSTVTVDVTGGNIVGTTSFGSGGGIVADGGAVTVTSDTTVKGLGVGSIGIEALGGAGNVTVISTGPLVTGAANAIFADTGSGTINVGTAGTPIAGSLGDATTLDAALRTSTFAGATNINIGAAASMAGDVNANFGVIAISNDSSPKATITINNAAQIGASGAGGGVNAGGIVASETNPFGTGSITINNSGKIFVDNVNPVGFLGLVDVNTSVGIAAVSITAQPITITNSGDIGTPGVGILAMSGAATAVANHGNISAIATGVDALGDTVQVTNDAAQLTSGGDGIFAIAFGGPAVVNQTAGAINAGAIGIYAQSSSGATTINASGGTIRAGTFGIASNGFNAITVNNGDAITGASRGGIGVGNFGGATGPIVINNSGDMSTLTSAFGIGASDSTGQINITNKAQIGSAGAGVQDFAIGAQSLGNNTAGITINNSGDLFAQGVVVAPFKNSAGIAAINAGTGAVVINNSGKIDPAGFGMFATGAGNVTVNNSGNITADVGIHADSTGSAAFTVTVDNFGGATVTGTVGNGIEALTSGSANIVVTAPDGGAITGVTNGILAQSAGAGTVNIQLGASSTVVANGTGAVNAGLGPVGINAIGGTGGVSVGGNTSTIVSTDASVIAAEGRAIVVASGNNAEIDIGPGAAIAGLGDAAHPVIDATAPAGATTTIDSFGAVGSVRALSNVEAGLGDLAIRATAASVVVSNESHGFIAGRMNFSGLTGASTVTLDNDANAVWETNGTSTFAPAGANTINNAGVIVTATDQTATTLAFGSAKNTINNVAGGTIVFGADLDAAGSGAAPAVTTITGAPTLTNNGLIIMGAAENAFRSDQVVNSVLEAPNTTLTGAGVIALDADLSSNAQSKAACVSATLAAADCLVVAATGGDEGIRVSDTRAHRFGAFNPGGIVIVSGATSGANFHLDPGSMFFNPGRSNAFGGAGPVIDKPGLFFYTLAFDAPNHDELIISVPKLSAFEFASLGGAVDDLWYQTTQNWFDRQADLRDGLGSHGGGSAPGVWLKLIGDWAGRDSQARTLTEFDQTFTFKVGYDQNTAGVVGGVDLVNVTGKNMAWVAGVEGGWIDSDVNFRASPDRFHVSGEDLGGYATYLSGALFIDGQVNANFLRLEGNLPGDGAGLATASHATSVGGQVEGGYQLSLNRSVFVEPLANLAYVSTSFGNLDVGGNAVKLSHADSFRGALGARVGVNQDFQFYRVKLALVGRVWDEFNNDTASDVIVPGGPDIITNDDLKGVFGEVQGEANLFANKSGLSAFVNGGVKFKDHYSDTNVTLGARYQW